MLPFDTSAGAVPRAPALAQALARCAAGAAQRRLILDRSGAERAECPVILGPAARRGTRCALAVSPAFRGAPEIAHAGLRLPRRWVRGVRGVGARAPPRGKSSCATGRWNNSGMLRTHAYQPWCSRQPHGVCQQHLPELEAALRGRPLRSSNSWHGASGSFYRPLSACSRCSNPCNKTQPSVSGSAAALDPGMCAATRPGC